MPFVHSLGANIYYEDTGGVGEVIFFTHGFGSGSLMWDKQVDELQQKFRSMQDYLSAVVMRVCGGG
jgi:pimeloyl-ACP methyl ester carboxylesterase